MDNQAQPHDTNQKPQTPQEVQQMQVDAQMQAQQQIDKVTKDLKQNATKMAIIGTLTGMFGAFFQGLIEKFLNKKK